MTADDFSQFAVALGSVGVTLGESLTPERIEAYFAALEDLPLEAVRAACRRANQTATYFPKPAELRALAGTAPPDVGLVEAMLCEHLRTIGSWRKPPKDPFLLLVIARLGGYRAVCEMQAGQRIFALRTVLPGAVQAATMEGIAMPNEATHAQLSLAARTMAQRAIEAADEHAIPYAEPPPGDTPAPGPRGNVVSIGMALPRKFGGAR